MFWIANAAVTKYNVALNQPAFQSSAWSGGYAANLANDGNRETCSASKRGVNPWWAVDLGRPTEIFGVNFINSGDGLGMREYTKHFTLLFYQSSLYAVNSVVAYRPCL